MKKIKLFKNVEERVLSISKKCEKSKISKKEIIEHNYLMQKYEVFDPPEYIYVVGEKISKDLDFSIRLYPCEKN